MAEKVEPHTPLPWRREHEYIVSENGIAHASFDYTLDANYIILACNSYPALLAERDRLREALKKIEKYPRPNNSTGRHARFYDGMNVAIDRISAIARAALKDTNQ